MLLNTCLCPCLISKKKVSLTEWEKCLSSASLNCNTAPFCPRFIDTRMHSIKPEKESKCVTKWSTTCSNYVSFMYKERKLMLLIRTIKTSMSLRTYLKIKFLMSTVAALRIKEIMDLLAAIEVSVAFWASKKLTAGLKVLACKTLIRKETQEQIKKTTVDNKAFKWDNKAIICTLLGTWPVDLKCPCIA